MNVCVSVGEPEQYPCWTITQSYWRRVPPPTSRENERRRGLVKLSLIVASSAITAITLFPITPWSTALVGAAIAAVGMLLAIVKLDELRQQRRWNDWPVKFEFKPGSATPPDDPLRGAVIELPRATTTTENWRRFLTDARNLPQHYAEVQWVVKKAEAELAHRGMSGAADYQP